MSFAVHEADALAVRDLGSGARQVTHVHVTPYPLLLEPRDPQRLADVQQELALPQAGTVIGVPGTRAGAGWLRRYLLEHPLAAHGLLAELPFDRLRELDRRVPATPPQMLALDAEVRVQLLEAYAARSEPEDGPSPPLVALACAADGRFRHGDTVDRALHRLSGATGGLWLPTCPDGAREVDVLCDRTERRLCAVGVQDGSWWLWEMEQARFAWTAGSQLRRLRFPSAGQLADYVSCRVDPDDDEFRVSQVWDDPLITSSVNGAAALSVRNRWLLPEDLARAARRGFDEDRAIGFTLDYRDEDTLTGRLGGAVDGELDDAVGLLACAAVARHPVTDMIRGGGFVRPAAQDAAGRRDLPALEALTCHAVGGRFVHEGLDPQPVRLAGGVTELEQFEPLNPFNG